MGKVEEEMLQNNVGYFPCPKLVSDNLRVYPQLRAYRYYLSKSYQRLPESGYRYEEIITQNHIYCRKDEL